MDGFVDDRLQRFPFRRDVNRRAGWGTNQWHERAALQGQMMRMNEITDADHDCALDDVLQLTNVARPVVALERVDGIRSQAKVLAPFALGITLHEIFREQ